jgi:dolichyl-phosphate-mannose-protein mannosyltransferase
MESRLDCLSSRTADNWSGPVTWFVLSVGFVLRVTNLGLLPPFLDESGVLNAALNYDIHPVMERLFLGKYLGYLILRPVLEFANDPIWAGRALSAIFGVLGALCVTYTVRRLADARAALTSAVLLALGPQLVFHDRLALPESLAFFFSSAGCLAWLLGRQEQRTGYFLLAGVGIACACATKVYTAPIFLLVPILARASLGGMSTLFKKEVPYMALGFVAACAIILLTALDQTWAKDLSLENLIRMPLMIVGNSGAVPLLGQRLINAGGFFSGYLPGTFWLLLALNLVSGSAFRKSVLGCLAVFAVVFFIYAIVFRTFTATRYFNVLWLPTAIGIGLSSARLPDLTNTFTAKSRMWVSRLNLGLLAIVAFQFTWRDRVLLIKPESFRLPHSDYYQYFSGWPSGRGLLEVSDYLQSRSLESGKPILVLTLIGFRHGNVSLPILTRKNPAIRFTAVWEGNDFAVNQLPSWLRGNLVFVVVEPMGTPVDFLRAQAAGFQSTLAFSAPDFEGSSGYRVFQMTQTP